MTDKVVIYNKGGIPRYIVEGDSVQPHPDHDHAFGWFSRKCKICRKTRKQLSKETR